MRQPCMQAYSLLLIRTCHRRGVHAMGGMAAQIPIKDNPAANTAALEKVGKLQNIECKRVEFQQQRQPESMHTAK